MPHPVLAAALAAALAAPAAVQETAPAAVQETAPAAAQETSPPAAVQDAAPPPAATSTVPTAAAHPLAAGAPLERAELVRAVLDANRSVEAARLAWRAALERPEQAAALPDPRLRYEVAPLSVAGGIRFGQELAVSQGIPYPGRRRAAAAVAEAEAAAAGEAYRALLLELATAASLAYDDLALVDRALELTREHERLLEDYLRIATARYAAGLVEQHEPLRAEVELTHLVHRRVVLEAERPTVVARLNALLHRPASTPLPPPPPPSETAGPAAAPTPEAIAAALADHPELARLDAEIAAREAELALARLERKPDLEAMASYSSMWNEIEHRVMAGVSLNLPLWRGRLDAAEAEADARLAGARAARAQLGAELAAEAAAAADRLAEADRVVELYRSRLVPAARDHVRAALAAFEAGGGPFLVLLDAERTLREVELAAAEAAADRERRRAELERALGRLPGLGRPPAPPAEATLDSPPASPAEADPTLQPTDFPAPLPESAPNRKGEPDVS